LPAVTGTLMRLSQRDIVIRSATAFFDFFTPPNKAVDLWGLISLTRPMSRDFASKGCKIISGTDPITGDFYGFTALEETVIAAIVAPDGPGPENTGYSITVSEFASLTIPAGVFLPIRCSSIDLTSGKLVAYLE
jgi:hypothetical protein